MADELLAPPNFVREEDDGSFSIIVRATGKKLGDSYRGSTAGEARAAALNHMITLPGFATATTTSDGSKREHIPLRDAATREEVGVWRWLDAAAAEDKPKPDGSRVTALGIPRMAALLNASTEPKVLDGGAVEGLGPSPVHASLKDSGTLARGWAYIGADWVDADGRPHLALYCEVFPEVDEAIDTGQLGFGSIGFGYSPTNPDDMELIQHSLTNRPATSGLIPGSAMRSTETTDGRRLGRGRPTRIDPMTNRNTSGRGPAADKLAQVQTALGIPAGTPQDDIWCMTWDAINALQQGATLEKILEGGGAPALARAEGETDEAFAARTAKLKPVAIVARAVGGVEGPALEDWASQVLAILQTLSAKADATAAEALDFLKANQDKIAGALAAAVPPAAGANGTEQQPPAAGHDATQARAERIGFETRIRALETSTADEKKRADELDKKVKRRELQDSIGKRFTDAKLVLVEASRDELVDMVIGKPEAEQKKIVDLAMRAAAGAPPTGTVPAGDGNSSQRQAAGGGTRSSFRSEQEALDHHTAAVRKEKPNATDTDVAAEAYQRARADFVTIQRSADADAE